MSIALTASGLPLGISLGDLERFIMSRITGRIVALGLKGEGVGSIELASADDAEKVVGEHELLGTKVLFARDSAAAAVTSGTAPPSSNKRTRSGSATPGNAIPPAPSSSNSNSSTILAVKLAKGTRILPL